MITQTIALGDYLALIAREAGDTPVATAKYEERLSLVVHRDRKPLLVSIEAIIQDKNATVGIFSVKGGEMNRMGIYDPTTGIFNLQTAQFCRNDLAGDVFLPPEEKITAYRPGTNGDFADMAFEGMAGPIFSGGSANEVAKLQRFIEGDGCKKPRLATYRVFQPGHAGWVIDNQQP